MPEDKVFNQQISKTPEMLYRAYFALPMLEQKQLEKIYHQRTGFSTFNIAPCIPYDKENMSTLEQTIRQAMSMSKEGHVRINLGEVPMDAVAKVLADLPTLDIDLQKRILFFFHNYADVLHNLKGNNATAFALIVARAAIFNNLANSHDYSVYLQNSNIVPELREKMISDLISQAKADIQTELKYSKKPEQIKYICDNVLVAIKPWNKEKWAVMRQAEFNPEFIMANNKQNADIVYSNVDEIDR